MSSQKRARASTAAQPKKQNSSPSLNNKLNLKINQVELDNQLNLNQYISDLKNLASQKKQQVGRQSFKSKKSQSNNQSFQVDNSKFMRKSSNFTANDSKSVNYKSSNRASSVGQSKKKNSQSNFQNESSQALKLNHSYYFNKEVDNQVLLKLLLGNMRNSEDKQDNSKRSRSMTAASQKQSQRDPKKLGSFNLSKSSGFKSYQSMTSNPRNQANQKRSQSRDQFQSPQAYHQSPQSQKTKIDQYLADKLSPQKQPRHSNNQKSLQRMNKKQDMQASKKATTESMGGKGQSFTMKVDQNMIENFRNNIKLIRSAKQKLNLAADSHHNVYSNQVNIKNQNKGSLLSKQQLNSTKSTSDQTQPNNQHLLLYSLDEQRKFLTSNQYLNSSSNNTNTLYSLQFQNNPQKSNSNNKDNNNKIKNIQGAATASLSLNKADITSFNMNELSNNIMNIEENIEDLQVNVIKKIQLQKRIVQDKEGKEEDDNEDMVDEEQNLQESKRSRSKSRCAKRKQSLNVVLYNGQQVISSDQ